MVQLTSFKRVLLLLLLFFIENNSVMRVLWKKFKFKICGLFIDFRHLVLAQIRDLHVWDRFVLKHVFHFI